ncbi:MAG: hypothetical protein FD130_2298 [Halothiobacillaceae bacterium]|nr:MAG: hypothetical protein FD130_2298 [Halothiobacillaceae bacterium]
MAGYCSGGSSTVATADKVDFGTDITAAQASANLSVAKGGQANCDNGTTKGYNIAGSSAAAVATTDKTTFAHDTTIACPSADLGTAAYHSAGISGPTFGYIAGGNTGAAATVVAYKLTYATDVTATQSSANLANAKEYHASVSERSTKGYWAGGTSAAGTQLATAEMITFSTDTTAAQASANLSQARYRGTCGCDGEGTKGYYLGGFTASANVVTGDKITYSTDTTAAQVSSNLWRRHNLRQSNLLHRYHSSASVGSADRYSH